MVPQFSCMFVCECVCVCMYPGVCMHAFMQLCTVSVPSSPLKNSMCVCVCVCVCVCMCICIYTHIHITHAYMYPYITNKNTLTRTNETWRIHMHACIHSYKQTNTYTFRSFSKIAGHATGLLCGACRAEAMMSTRIRDSIPLSLVSVRLWLRPCILWVGPYFLLLDSTVMAEYRYGG